jgi:hypothetical protein
MFSKFRIFGPCSLCLLPLSDSTFQKWPVEYGSCHSLGAGWPEQGAGDRGRIDLENTAEAGFQ